MMKVGTIALSGMAAIFLGGCSPGIVPVPSYSVDSYAGSLDRCLDIQGTYMNLYEDTWSSSMLNNFLPRRFDRKSHEDGFQYFVSVGERKNRLQNIDTWTSFRFLDGQRLEASVFNVEGQSFTMVLNMQEKDEALKQWEEEKFSCDASSWQMSYTSAGYAEGTRSKWRRFVKVTRPSSDILKMESKGDDWRGSFGLYLRNFDSDSVGYFRKVDLTIDDIRAMNDKAKRAIEQYDQLSVNPPSVR